ncbi:MAG: 4-hydroxy-tetrahydrodipicolinate synthase, partial [Clostridia bacterium]|nr:4-hydroxy-tetrahydrodipicolinate synthase [Clostridia bacterium]
ELLLFQLANKTKALVICGTTGEASAMDEKEQMEVLKFCIEKMKGKITMLAGTGSNNADKAIRLSSFAEKIGYDGVLVVTPYYNKATPKGLCEYYGAIAKSVKIPVILYNVPGRTGVSISLETLKILDEKYENIIGIKEASGDVAFAGKILAETNLVVYSGNDDVALPIMAVGGSGVISVIANIFPFEVYDFCNDFENGNLKLAQEKFLAMLDCMSAMFFEVNPIPVKTAMNILGFDVGKLRLPLCEMEEKNVERLKKSLLSYKESLR